MSRIDFNNIFNSELELLKNRRNKVGIKKRASYNRSDLFESVSVDNEFNVDMEQGVIATESFESLPINIREEFVTQRLIRELFGKGGINCTSIGDHPDFSDIKYDDSTVNQYICTIFFDIKGSTRLSLLYDLEEVFLIKNSMLKATIELIRSFDGYVHRLMGDAVMAFFGSKYKSKEDAVIDAINCCMTLKMFMDQSVKPSLEQLGFDIKDLGFRVGCDFGDDDKVLWGAYGYGSVGEISPTGLPVDMASKLQSLADNNSVMLGQGLLDFIPWPDIYSQVKTAANKSCYYVTPNITDKDGNNLNYKMRMLDYDSALEFSALPLKHRANIVPGLKWSSFVSYKCYVLEDSTEVEYFSSSRALASDLALRFEILISANSDFIFPLIIQMFKKNNGKFVPDNENKESLSLNKIVNKSIKDDGGILSFNNDYKITLDERTAYRGLHTMKCIIMDANRNRIYENSIGIHIK